jgi:hypothetical protein
VLLAGLNYVRGGSSFAFWAASFFKPNPLFAMSQKLRCFLLSLCGLCGITVAHAQADFRAGYIVPLSGDTVRGLADYRGGLRSAELCRFRPAAGAEAVSYTPAQLRGYGFESGRHYRAQLLAAIDSVQYQATPPPRLVFMEVLASGPLNLYQLRSKAGVDRYFVAPAASTAGPATELIPFRNPGSDYLTRAYLRANLYRGVLTELMTDCPAVRIEVGSVPFTTNALTSLVQRYNACRTPAASSATASVSSPSPAVPARPVARPNERVKLSVVAGIERAHFAVTGVSFLAKGNFVTTAPLIGLGLTIPFASISEKLSLRIEALVEHQGYEDTVFDIPGFSVNNYGRVQLRLTYLRVPLLLRYTYPVGKLRPFAQAGVSFAQRLRFDNTLQIGQTNNAGVVQYDAPRPLESLTPGIVGYEIGLLGSLGAHLPSIAGRALTLEVRAEGSSGMIITTGINSSQQRYSALLSYNLTK